MKNTKHLLLLMALALSFVLNAQSNEAQCTDLRNNIPKDLLELSQKTRLNIDLNNHCTFQPVHYQVRREQPTTEIIARFTGKKNGDDFAIEKIELKHFEVTENPRTVIIDTAYFKTEGNMKIIVVELRNLDDPKWTDATARKQRLAQEIVDFVLIPDKPEIVNKDMIVDIHITNEEALYPKLDILRYNGEEILGRPFGRHCNNNIVY